MTTLTLDAVDGGLRARLTEEQWAGLVAGTLGPAGGAALPSWAGPLTPAADSAEGDDGWHEDLTDVAAPLTEALLLHRSAVLEVDVAVAVGDRAVQARLWTDGTVGASVVRGLDVRPQAGARATRLRAGVEVSAFPVSALLDEVLRLVPPAPEPGPGEVPAVTLPVELTVGFAAALRRGDARTLAAICADLGLERPPSVFESLVRTQDGSMIVSVRSAGTDRVSALSWLHCQVGWVELVPTPDQQIRHVPRRRSDLERLVLTDLSGRLDLALSERQAGDEEER